MTAYCRAVTQVWCAFLLANAAVCLTLALFAPLASWALYTGFLSYVLMGMLFAVEWCVRQPRLRAARAVVSRSALHASAGV